MNCNLLEKYLSGYDVNTIVDGNPYILNRKDKNSRNKLKALISILDENCSVNYIGFNDRDIGSDCFVIQIRKDYNIIVKNKIDEWALLHLIFGSMTEINQPIDFEKLKIEYPRMINGCSTTTNLKYLTVE